MNPSELHSDFVRNRFDGFLQEAAVQRELPSLGQRLARRFQDLIDWLKPDAPAVEPLRKRAAS